MVCMILSTFFTCHKKCVIRAKFILVIGKFSAGGIPRRKCLCLESFGCLTILFRKCGWPANVNVWIIYFVLDLVENIPTTTFVFRIVIMKWWSHNIITLLILMIKCDALNTLRPRHNGRHIPDDIFKWIFLNENVWISINISLKFVPRGPINNIPTLVQVMAWRRPGDKPLSEPMMVRLPTHICLSASMSYNSIIICPFGDLVKTPDICI